MTPTPASVLAILACDDPEAIEYENETLRNPYSLKTWLRYLESKKQASSSTAPSLLSSSSSSSQLDSSSSSSVTGGGSGMTPTGLLLITAARAKSKSSTAQQTSVSSTTSSTTTTTTTTTTASKTRSMLLRKARFLIYERALAVLPGSYKLWFGYLQERVRSVKHKSVDHPSWDLVNQIFERSLVFMHKMPCIWEEYANFLILQRKVTLTRRVLDRALHSLPITQHDRIWRLYLKFVKQPFVPSETKIHVYRRFVQLEPDQAEDYIEFLLEIGAIDEAVQQLAKLLSRPRFVSTRGKTHHDLWMQLCELVTKNPRQVRSIRVETLIRSGLKQFRSEVGQLWCALAEYYIRLGQFERARNVFEEAMLSVNTVRDFSQVFDAYAKTEESLITTMMEMLSAKTRLSEMRLQRRQHGDRMPVHNDENDNNDDDEEEEDDDEEEEEEEQAEIDRLEKILGLSQENELNRHIAQLEDLLDRRPVLLSDVLLRQNPHNVHEWIKRVRLFREKDPERAIRTYNEAVRIIDTAKSIGPLQTLWINFARFYERYHDLESARTIFERAVQVNYRQVGMLATVWCEYAEMELRNQNHSGAIKLLQRATTVVRRSKRQAAGKQDPGNLYQDEPVQHRVWKDIRLWSLYADLEENFGTMETIKAVYDRIIELKIATPQLILNYCRLLEENDCFEDAFKAYEKAVNLFSWPQLFPIWVTYLTQFVNRYGGRKLERARDLFEQAVANVPAEFARPLYLLFAKLEEDYGLSRHAMGVYERATKAVREEEQAEMFYLYINRAAEFFGVTKTREIYERAISSLTDKYVKDMCLKYADMECKLGEIDRARAIFVHASQYCDPRVDTGYWNKWYEFEVQHGNEDTFREMLRVKRSVQTLFNTSVNIMTAGMLAAHTEHEKLQQQQQQEQQMQQQQAARESRKRPRSPSQTAAEAANEEEIPV